MKAHFSRFMPQPLTAIVINILALIILSASWVATPAIALDSTSTQVGTIAIFLTAAVIGAGLNPIHLRPSMKVVLTTIPLYVAAMLLPPAVAALTAGISNLVVQLMIRSHSGNKPSDIATAAGRWVIIAFLSAWVAQRATNDQLPVSLVLLSVAVVMFTSDIVTAALEIAPMSGEPPWRVMVVLLREISLPEGTQYLLGILAILAATQQAWSLVLWVLPTCIVYRSFKQAKEMHDGTSKLLESMADAVDLRDPYTGGHSRRVTEYSLHILHEMGVMGPEVDLIRSAARVHDIGKIGIPDQILNKPGRLTDEEKRIMDSHPARGAELLARYTDFARGMDIVRHHHERWDGQGYPDRLKGLDIPFGARVIAVADSFDAMTSDRPYRIGMPTDKAAQILREGRGHQWEATIVDAFLSYLEKEHPQARLSSTVTAANSISMANSLVEPAIM
jgi:putative nucleotidyltransferase with HDIG domain